MRIIDSSESIEASHCKICDHFSLSDSVIFQPRCSLTDRLVASKNMVANIPKRCMICTISSNTYLIANFSHDKHWKCTIWSCNQSSVSFLPFVSRKLSVGTDCSAKPWYWADKKVFFARYLCKFLLVIYYWMWRAGIQSLEKYAIDICNANWNYYAQCGQNGKGTFTLSTQGL